ncbi:MAG: HD domain-containing protein [Methanosarcinaceae archaeon]|nr:HD domain-containing protein [Methanosarcinaceae archaeon]
MESRVIMDPVHGYIELGTFHTDLLDTKRMQRLRRIKQLGFAYFVYPGANHTRFEHSIGTMHLATKLFELGNMEIYEDLKDEIVASALLHDVGHGPFSHATEKVIEKYTNRSHDDVRKIISSGEIGDILRDNGMDPSKIAKHIKGETELSRVLNSEIDVDKMDYLARDMHYTGVASGRIDTTRLLKHMGFYNRRFMLSPSAIKAAEALLVSRYWMNSSVYYHHVSRIAEAMCDRACRDLIENKKLRAEDLADMDDISLICFMREDAKKYGKESYPGKIIERLDSRNLYKRAVYVGVDSVNDTIFKQKENTQRAEKEIEEMAKVEPGDVLIDIPRKPDIVEMKARIFVNENSYNLIEVSPFISVLSKAHEENWKMGVFSPKEKIEAVRKAACEYYNIKPTKKTVQFTMSEYIS